MGEIIALRAKKLTGFIPVVVCADCIPNGAGGFVCRGGKCAVQTTTPKPFVAPESDPA